VLKAHLVPTTELKQRVLEIAINEGHRGKSSVQKTTLSEGCVTEIRVLRFNSIEIALVGGNSNEGTIPQVRSRENRLEHQRIIKPTLLNRSQIGEDALQRGLPK